MLKVHLWRTQEAPSKKHEQTISVIMSPAGRWIAILFLKLLSPIQTRILYAANYGGTVSRLSLKEQVGGYSLSLLAETHYCGYNPAWLELDRSTNILLCLNEAYVSPQSQYWREYPGHSLKRLTRALGLAKCRISCSTERRDTQRHQQHHHYVWAGGRGHVCAKSHGPCSLRRCRPVRNRHKQYKQSSRAPAISLRAQSAARTISVTSGPILPSRHRC